MDTGAIIGISIGSAIAIVLAILVTLYFVYYKPQLAALQSAPTGVCNASGSCPSGQVCSMGSSVCVTSCSTSADCPLRATGQQCIDSACVFQQNIYGIDSNGALYAKALEARMHGLLMSRVNNGTSATAGQASQASQGSQSGQFGQSNLSAQSAALNLTLQQSLNSQGGFSTLPWYSLGPIIFSTNPLDSRITDIYPIAPQPYTQAGNSKAILAIVVRASDYSLYKMYTDLTTDPAIITGVPTTATTVSVAGAATTVAPRFTSLTFDSVGGKYLATTADNTIVYLNANTSDPIQVLLTSSPAAWISITPLQGLPANKSISNIATGRSSPRFVTNSRNYFVIDSSLGSPILYQSTNLTNWFVATTATVGALNRVPRLPGDMPSDYFGFNGLTYDKQHNYYYVIPSSNKGVCQTVASIGTSTTDGGALNCLSLDTSIQLQVIRV